MSFTDQMPQIATANDVAMCWNGGRPGERFRCNLCGHRFKVGDKWRWLFDNYKGGAGNFLVCGPCDGDDVIERWREHAADVREAGWWMVRR